MPDWRQSKCQEWGLLSWLLSFGGQVSVCDEHLPDSEPSEVELTVPGAVSRPATLAEVRLPKMDGAGS